MQSKVLAKIEQIARWRVAGIKDSTIAQKLGMSYAGLTRILQTPFYKQREREVRQFLISKMDESLVDTRTEILKGELQDAVPDALKHIIDTCRNGADLRARLAASKEILDRDPRRTFVKGTSKETETSQRFNDAKLPENIMNAARKESGDAQSLIEPPMIPMQKPGEA